MEVELIAQRIWSNGHIGGGAFGECVVRSDTIAGALSLMAENIRGDLVSFAEEEDEIVDFAYDLTLSVERER